ncbi:Redox-sensing transcriptional repressor Rex [Petrocella atlantisensis]|uniref:Redox-sensing transcriptional repressor Rex n=1 Tax=Petrocella atlantisensis TaxID=2173034 RepID=A0A3P7Q1J8_9FIRM|nr:redox-sensing transcriptional repressor Rex [Petrocella atlantisensis]MCF8018384.1 redox-sensing transcriptional repressor Rex [Vallitaleaceae bacterium]PKM53958.1 MAG: redox-sensing transcriptional repressor Rex [Firmicutes bacterium HGW-Firmicutes-5]VDN49211.1 Redox-sensing transcriptional repressor Rex [Petrocella atlantisensis]
MSDKKISTAVIKRLPRYYRYLGELLENDIVRISSNELSQRMGVTASQIRQDLNNFGGFGQQGYGYNVNHLYKEIAKILGLENHYSVIIIGSGNLGQALANYTDFEKRGFVVKGLFDVNPRLVGISVRGMDVQDMDQLKDFVVENNIDIAILTVPKTKAPAIANDLCEWGIRGIWNFAPVDLQISNFDVVVENVHLSESLMTLSYRIKDSY